MQTDLYKKYRADHYNKMPALDPLGFILRKAEIGGNLTSVEWSWLERQQLIDTITMIKDQEDRRDAIRKEVRGELLQLKKNRFVWYSITTVPTIDSEIAFTLYKVNAQERLDDSELRLVGSGYHRFLDFNERKRKHVQVPIGARRTSRNGL